ncbi:hypothetical protein VTO73DRAFT_12818 [Trametes versicolor]
MSDQINPSASLVSLATTAESEAPATPSASTTTLIPKSASSNAPAQTLARTSTTTPPAKNYEQAFAALSSSYGFAGTVPTKNPKKDKKTKKRTDKTQNLPKGDTSGSAQGGSSAGGGQSAPAK